MDRCALRWSIVSIAQVVDGKSKTADPQASKPKWSARSLLSALLNLGLVATAAAAVIGWLSPWLSWPADMFAPFRLQYAALFLTGGLVAAALRSPKTAAAAVVLFIWQAASLIPLMIDPGRGEPTGETLRLLHFNVLAYNTDYDAAGDWLAAQEADIIVLQETTPEWGAAMEAALSDWTLLDTDTVQPGTYGIMMFAGPDVEVVEARAVEFEWYPAIATTVRVDNQELLIYGVHTLIPVYPNALSKAKQQVDLAAEIVNAHDGPAVVVGDLNATRWSPVYRRLTDQVQLNDVADGGGLKGTWPNRLWFTGRIGIDHVLTSPGMCSFDRRLGPGLGSDHLPVVVDLTVAGCD